MRYYILAESRVEFLYGKDDDGYLIIERIKGRELEGIEYEPLFGYFSDKKNDGCFRVLLADFVSHDTGIL